MISEDIVAEVDSVAAQARRVETPSGEGAMVWHIWGSGPPLLLLHGGYGSWMHWIRNVLPLSHHFTLLVPDMPGLGDSALPPAPVDPDSIATVLAAGIATLIPGDQTFQIAGFSFGGLIGGCMAVQPGIGDRISQLILVGSGGLGLICEPTPLARVPGGATETEMLAVHRRNLEILMIADPAKIDPLCVYVQSRNAARGRVKSRPFGGSDMLARMLPRVKCRFDGIWGERDATAFPYLDGRRELLQGVQPQARFEIVPQAGHWVMYEAPELFDRVLLDLLAS